jgi:hypothetical protein
MANTVQNQTERVREIFALYRGILLDAIEQELGDTPNWQFLRGRLLKFLSPERGLEARIIEVLKGS